MLLMSVPTYFQFKLKKIKDFEVETLFNVDIIDYFPKSKLYLGFMNSNEREGVLLNNNIGEIIADKNLKGQGPNQYVQI
jgi:hypothetical protein